MIKIIILTASALSIAYPSFAGSKCYSSKEIQQLVKSRGLKEKGAMVVEGGNAGSEVQDIAYVNDKTKTFLSVKKKGKCFFDPTFLSEASYEEIFQFEGDSEEGE
ncbi:hypothetical protein [Rhizobium leucaenae]|uniref:hypothetical protein n=1 Tax=Rhizobium leucaenae TaxID=29450 RepID=UPI00160D75DE|nr:hypothetical protein [Rhizobium leucaenae]MBB6304761.1 hypothetical protein [Rhizobium leucaenae]